MSPQNLKEPRVYAKGLHAGPSQLQTHSSWDWAPLFHTNMRTGGITAVVTQLPNRTRLLCHYAFLAPEGLRNHHLKLYCLFKLSARHCTGTHLWSLHLESEALHGHTPAVTSPCSPRQKDPKANARKSLHQKLFWRLSELKR